MEPKTNGKNKPPINEDTWGAHCVAGLVLGAGAQKNNRFYKPQHDSERGLGLKLFIVNFWWQQVKIKSN